MAHNAEQALVKRINRRLAREGEYLRCYRGTRWYSSLGTWYIVNQFNAIVAAHIDLATLAEEIGCPLKDYHPPRKVSGFMR